MLKSVLKPESAVTTGILEAIGIYLIYNGSMPSLIDLKSAPQHDSTAESTRKTAAIESAALLGIVFAITRDFNAFIIGGVAMVGIDFMFKHGNAVNPQTGKMDTSGSGQSVAPSLETGYSLPAYESDMSAN